MICKEGTHYTKIRAEDSSDLGAQASSARSNESDFLSGHICGMISLGIGEDTDEQERNSKLDLYVYIK